MRKFSAAGRVAAVLLALAAVGVASASAQTWPGLRAQGQQIVDAAGRNVILRGFGPGEWYNTEAYMIEWKDADSGQYLWYYGATRIHATMTTLMGAANANEFKRRWEANLVTESDIALMRSWGANSIRISVNYHWLSPSRGVYLDTGWARIDQLIAWSKAHGLVVVVALHAAPGAQSNELMADTPDGVAHLWTEPSKYQPWTIDLWQAIAQRYAAEPTVAGYDLLDEPIPPSGRQGDVRPFYMAVTSAIRAVDPNHILFVEGTNWAGDEEGMRAILPPWDDNLVYVFHKYWDTNDTASIQGYLDIRNQYNVPLWNGETGENTDAWAKGMVTLLERNNIGWNAWTYKKVNQSQNPYTIAEPAGYSKILNYANNGGAAPSPAEATTILLALADNAATSKCRFNGSLITALFGAVPRPTPTATAPTPTPTVTPGPRATATPTPTPRPSGGFVEVAPVAVTASTHDGNVPANAVDGSLATRWSANGDGHWLKLDLGSAQSVAYVSIAAYNGNLRQTRFDLQISSDDTTWTTVLAGASGSGTTTAEEVYDFADVQARWVRYLGHGNSASLWNSLTEVSVFTPAGGPTPIPSATPTVTPTPGTYVDLTPAAGSIVASTSDTNVPANTVDGNLSTRWSGNGDGAWIQYDVGSMRTLGYVTLAVYNGTSRQNRFDLQVSNDATSWTTVFSGSSSGTTTQQETYDFADVSGRYVRYLGHGSTIGTWNSVTELRILGR